MPFFLFLPALIFSSSLSQNSTQNKLFIAETNPVILAIVDEPIILAQFAADTTHGEAPLTVTFTNLSENATAYVWDFGDGDTSSIANPIHIYIGEGSYTVSLVASNENGSDIETKTSYINVSQPFLTKAIFTAEPIAGEFPLEVTFTNNSVNATEFFWSFGDGETSSEISPVHTYVGVGDYTVSLVVSNGSFTDTLTKANYINVFWPAPIANFSADPVEGIDPLTVVFTDKSENAQTWLWDFGDGSNSTEQNPTHIYTHGTYSVSLLITNPAVNDFILMQNLISVDPNGLSENIKSKLKIFPNPAKEMLTIELLNENYEHVEFEFIDASGKILKKVKPNLNNTIKQNINICDWVNGVYFLRVCIENETVVMSFTKNN